MAHPLLTAHPRLIAAIGLTGALLVPAAPVVAMGGGLAGPVEGGLVPTTQVCDSVMVIDPACTAVEQVVEGVVDAAAPLAADVLSPVTDQLPTEVLPGPVVELLPAPVAEVLGGGTPSGGGSGSGGGAPGVGGGGTGGTGGAGGALGAEPQPAEPTKVEAAGKGPEEIAEPQAPRAADGRVAGGPTIQPLDVSAMGGNIAGIRSQNGVTLQPFDAPLVSVPMDAEVPMVAGVPVTTASPTAALASQVVSFAGDAVLPQTTGAAGWVTATGLAMVAGAAMTVRRRLTTLAVGTLDN